MLSVVAHPHSSYRLGDFIRDNLQNAKWKEFRASVAFVKKSGTEYIKDALGVFSTTGKIRITAGIDHGGSSFEALSDILNSVSPGGQLWVYKNQSNTFHPKVFLFKNDSEADILVGSGNLTKGGLYENAELGVRIKLDLSSVAHSALLQQLEDVLDIWSKFEPGLCLQADNALLQLLKDSGELPTEAEASAATLAAKSVLKPTGAKTPSPFKSKAIPMAPALSTGSKQPTSTPVPASLRVPSTNSSTSVTSSLQNPAAASTADSAPITFGMTLQNTDVGYGQVTSGTAQRSPEIFIPLSAMDKQPVFWGWRNSYTPDPSRYQSDAAWSAKNSRWMASHAGRQRPLDKFDWYNVQISLKGQAGLISARFWYNPKKLDIRMRDNALRSAGSVNDILLIRQATSGSLHHYDMEVVKPSDPSYSQILSKLTNKVNNSQKRFGYF